MADSLLRLSRKVYSLSYEAENERLLSAAVREIHKKRENTLAVKPPDFLQAWMEDIKLLPAIHRSRYQQGMPDESRISQFKELMGKEGYIRITPELAAQAEKFRLPRYTLQKDGTIGYAYDIQQGKKDQLFLMKEDWLKLLDILVNEKPVYCSKELLVSMKSEAKYEISRVKKETDKTAFVSIVRKLTCFLEAMESHNLSYLLKENAVEKTLPDFLSADEKEKLDKMYRFPAKEHSIVADRSIRYPDAVAR